MCVGAGVGDRSRMARVGCEGAAPVLELAASAESNGCGVGCDLRRVPRVGDRSRGMRVGAGVGDRSRLARVSCEEALPVLELAASAESNSSSRVAIMPVRRASIQARLAATCATIAASRVPACFASTSLALALSSAFFDLASASVSRSLTQDMLSCSCCCSGWCFCCHRDLLEPGNFKPRTS